MPIFDLTIMQREISQALTSALRMLGIRSVCGCPTQYAGDFLNRLKTNKMDFDLLHDFDALCGSVGHSYYWLDKQHPDAQFVFVKQDPEVWAKAVIAANQTVVAFTNPLCTPNGKPELNLFALARLLNIRCIRTEDVDYLVHVYKVREFTLTNYFADRPVGKVLFMDLADGWEPLCKFLGRNVPTASFPVVETA